VEEMMSVAELEKVAKAWPPISRAVRVPHTEADYQKLVELLDHITDEVGEDENHPARFTHGCARGPYRKIRG
jgi:HTH-type transcriptional regulator / antitoxin HigA